MIAEKFVDITEHISKNYYNENVLLASASGKNVLILSKMNEPISRYDGKFVSFCLEYRWLSMPIDSIEDANKENYVCVQGSEFSYYSRTELMNFGILNKKGKVKTDVHNLFEYFNLF